MSLRTRISVALILASMMTAILVLAGSIWIISGIINRANERELQGQYSALVSRLEMESRQGAAMSSVVAQIPAVQEAMASADRAVLLAMFGSGFATLKSAYGVDQFQFHTAPAIVVSSHSPAGEVRRRSRGLPQDRGRGQPRAQDDRRSGIRCRRIGIPRRRPGGACRDGTSGRWNSA